MECFDGYLLPYGPSTKGVKLAAQTIVRVAVMRIVEGADQDV
jgi:hypothetical protein